MSITRTSTDNDTPTTVSAEDATREIFAAMSTGATVTYYGRYGLELTAADNNSITIFGADPNSLLSRSVISLLLTLWSQVGAMSTFRDVELLHAALRRSQSIGRYTRSELMHSVGQVWHQRNSGREDILMQLLALIGGDVHREIMTT